MNSIDLYVDEMLKQAQESLELDFLNARMRSIKTRYGNNNNPLIDTGCLVRYEGVLMHRKYFPTREQCKCLRKFGHKKKKKQEVII